MTSKPQQLTPKIEHTDTASYAEARTAEVAAHAAALRGDQSPNLAIAAEIVRQRTAVRK